MDDARREMEEFKCSLSLGGYELDNIFNTVSASKEGKFRRF